MSEPREWLVWWIALQNRWYAKPIEEGPREASIHVIEKSAYDAAQAEIERLNKLFMKHRLYEEYECEIEKLKAERDQMEATMLKATNMALDLRIERDQWKEMSVKAKLLIQNIIKCCQNFGPKIVYVEPSLTNAITDAAVFCDEFERLKSKL